MNPEFIAMLDYLERERGIKREILLEAVSNALLSASKKSVGASRDLHIDINRKTGEIRALANLLVVDHVTNPQDEIELSKARKIKPDANIGDTVEVEVTPKNFGRIAAPPDTKSLAYYATESPMGHRHAITIATK